MAIQCTGIQIVGGTQHEHIAHFRWTMDGTNNAGICTRTQMVAFVEHGEVAYVRDAFGNVAFLGVRLSAYGDKYVQTHAEGVWTDVLLSLPRF